MSGQLTAGPPAPEPDPGAAERARCVRIVVRFIQSNRALFDAATNRGDLDAAAKYHARWGELESVHNALLNPARTE